MNKCPQCLSGLSESGGVCKKCGFRITEDITKTRSMLELDETQATRILAEESMTPEKWQKIKGLFEAAQELSPDKRGEFLKNACRDDEELRTEVEKLLSSAENADSSFLEEPAIKEAASIFEEGETKALNQTTGKISSESFVAGTLLDKRYRIIGLLGKGGMGEVYKAEDIKLDQTVALKFLPEKLSKNEDALRRFIGEVKTARQVSHENVCRVFDIDETAGKQFISMEFIDGDDLSILLKRVGRLPSERATEISRQICLGLGAIHKAGILHRDLKPANIIIDSNGIARITDFGIAGFEENLQGAEARVGTPAYMSPEQLTGGAVSKQSDIYSLGLLIYEIFTGKQAVEGESINELIRKHQSTNPTNPSQLVDNLDPLVEKIIDRCLEKHPGDRPESPRHVALALPGANPLEAAIAIGETPTPEMVAAAPKKGVLRPLYAIGIFVALTIVYFATQAIHQDLVTFGLTPFKESPEVLAKQSRDFLDEIGLGSEVFDDDYQFVEDASFLNFYKWKDSSLGLPPRRQMLSDGIATATYFLYRRSPSTLSPGQNISIREKLPPLDSPGMANMKLDPGGRLYELVSVPEPRIPESIVKGVDWTPLFKASGFDVGDFKESSPTFIPPFYADRTFAWAGTLKAHPEIRVRVEAAEFGGKPVYFKVLYPWSESAADSEFTQTLFDSFFVASLVSLFAFLFFVAAYLANRNLNAGRGDLRGVFRLFMVVLITFSAHRIFQADHVPSVFGEIQILAAIAAYGLLGAILVSLAYLAFEPFVRKLWPEVLISWTRLLSGDYRDPMVGRDILVGAMLAIGSDGFGHLVHILVQWLEGDFGIISAHFDYGPLSGTSGLFGGFVMLIPFAIFFGFFLLSLAFAGFMLSGRRWVGIGIVGLLHIALNSTFALSLHPLALVDVSFTAAIIMLALGRHGLLGLVTYAFTGWALSGIPVVLDQQSYLFPQSILTMAITLGIIAVAVFVSIGGSSAIRVNRFVELE